MILKAGHFYYADLEIPASKKMHYTPLSCASRKDMPKYKKLGCFENFKVLAIWIGTVNILCWPNFLTLILLKIIDEFNMITLKELDKQ